MTLESDDPARPPDAGPSPFGDLSAAAAAFEASSELTVVTDGPELRMVAFNAGARAVTQDRMVVGQPILETFPDELVGQGWPEAYRVPTETGETVTVREARVHLHQPDGTIEERYLDCTFVPRFGDDGRPRGTICYTHDVTEQVLRRRETERRTAHLQEQYALARGDVRAMQRALLADAVPVLPGFDVAARYVLASDQDQAGGDWFDAVPGADGSVLLAVGDVVGHGQQAAVAMGQLRSVLLAQLRAGVDLRDALQLLDHFAGTVPAARRATVCLARISRRGDVEYLTAGHPPPLVLGDGDRSRYLEPTGAGPLGTGSAPTTAHAHLAAEDVLVLYTDGILERPGTAPASAAVELLSTGDAARRNTLMADGAASSACERVCALTIELLTRITGHADDITVLAAQPRPAPPPLELRLPPTSGSVGLAREQVRAWAEEQRVAAPQVDVLILAVTELCANVLDHAHVGREPGPFVVRAVLGEDAVVSVQVEDSGSWKIPVLGVDRGRGHALLRQASVGLAVDTSTEGTTVTATLEATRPAGMLETTGPGRAHEPEFFDVWSHGGPEPFVALVGPLDAGNVPLADPHLQLALSEAGTHLTVDLSGASLLASAGVDLLFRILDHARAAGLEVRLIAPNGSPAQHVLSLVGLGHHALDEQPPT